MLLSEWYAFLKLRDVVVRFSECLLLSGGGNNSGKLFLVSFSRDLLTFIAGLALAVV